MPVKNVRTLVPQIRTVEVQVEVDVAVPGITASAGSRPGSAAGSPRFSTSYLASQRRQHAAVDEQLQEWTARIAALQHELGDGRAYRSGPRSEEGTPPAGAELASI